MTPPGNDHPPEGRPAAPPDLGADYTLGVLGVGNMGEALVRGVVSCGALPAARVVVFDPRADLCAALHDGLGVTVAASAEDLAGRVDALLLCVKPQVLVGLLADTVGPALRQGALVISVAAGVTLAALEGAVRAGTPVIRAMPNTPCLVGSGVSAWAVGAAATSAHGAVAATILGAVGDAYEVEEHELDAVTAVSGSGPAYVFHLMEAMIEGGVKAGLDPDRVRAFVLGTVRGAAALALASDVPPGELRRRVMSPGGTTEAAVRALDDAGFQAGVVRAVAAARDRSVEMARAFGKSAE